MEFWKNNSNKLKATTAVLLASAALTGCGYRAEAKSSQPIAPQAMEAPQPAAIVPGPVKPSIAAQLERDWATILAGHQGSVDIAIRDRVTGQTAEYSTDGDRKTFNTASTIKLPILMELLLQNQAKNLPFTTCPEHPEVPMPVQLTCEQLDYAIPMIEESSDDDASALWVEEGDPTALQDFYTQIGATSTTPDPNSQWGWSTTSAGDQLKVLNLLSDPASPLTSESKATISFMMDHVVPEQHWGTSAGVPAAAIARLKNGWMESSLQTKGPATINSIANVKGNGVDYDIAVLTDGNPSDQAGIDTIEQLSRTTVADLQSAA